ncbi:tRNA N(3)-methylcytidine methyltransferase trm141-like isoform X2 [Curcuma longa]|uniref:tRNA N(3)-methylcytidine methyltransferase trm141-like isoform X2 n=1 Tax=Curcuma longa TaxID=136217 RepID=UPI003D9F3E27
MPTGSPLYRRLGCRLRSPSSLRLASSARNRGIFFLRCFCSSNPVPRMNYLKYERNPTKYWEDFYKRHHDKFFKDRHYLEKDWGRFFCSSSDSEHKSVEPKMVLEVGCGVGNTLLPLLASFPNVFVHACDFSPHAVALVKENGAFASDRLNTFVCDVTKDELSKTILPSSVDIVTMIFMLSAVSPMNMPAVLQNVRTIIKPNGYVLFRDYAFGDFAQVKLANKGQMISENFFVRGDGTCAFYFSEDKLSDLFERNGFRTLDMNVYCKEIVNRSQNVVMDRRWVRATFCCVEQPD